MGYYNFFSKLPIIDYKDNRVVNITAKVKLTDYAKEKGIVFYPYTIKEGERPDTLAYEYYGDSRYDWLIFMANDIVDPYYDWPLDYDKFKSFIISKYGSVSRASRKILFYQNNWQDDERILTTSQFAALPSNIKRYWNPITGYAGSITGYQRAPSDEATETNKTLSLEVVDTGGFIKGSTVTQTENSNTIATAEIKYISNTHIVVQKVTGEFNTTGSLKDDESGSSSTVSSITTLDVSIANDIAAYWSPVYAYVYEEVVNENKRNIKMIDRAYVSLIEDDFASIF